MTFLKNIQKITFASYLMVVALFPMYDTYPDSSLLIT